MKSDAASRYFTTGEVAASLGVTVRTLQQWIRDGRYPSPPRNSRGHFEWTRADLADLRSLPRLRPGRPAQPRAERSADAA